jgi:hypothetical protein
MLVGPVFDVRSHGQSRICRNLGHVDADPHDAVLAEARVDEEDVIYATVEMTGPYAMNGHLPAPAPESYETLQAMFTERGHGDA